MSPLGDDSGVPIVRWTKQIMGKKKKKEKKKRRTFSDLIEILRYGWGKREK